MAYIARHSVSSCVEAQVSDFFNKIIQNCCGELLDGLGSVQPFQHIDNAMFFDCNCIWVCGASKSRISHHQNSWQLNKGVVLKSDLTAFISP